MAERRIRHKARKLGYRLHKTRKPFGVDNYGHFTVVDVMGTRVLGPSFEATLEEIEAWLLARR